jgi:nucleoside transporter
MANNNPYSASQVTEHGLPWIRTKLGVMMFLQFFIWGSWLPLIFTYLPSLKFTSPQQSWILNAFAIASLTALFFSNQFADRYFAAEKFMSFSHLIGGLSILALAWVKDFWPFFGLMLVHSLFYVPTISIGNSIAFANLADPKRDFGKVRLWGTIGWIAASWPFVFILIDWAKVPALSEVGFVDWLGTALGSGLTGDAAREGTRWTFIVAGIASLVLAAFSLILPHTPPKPAAAGEESFFSALTKSVVLLKYPFMLVLFIATFIDACVHQGYFVLAGGYLEKVGIPSNWVMPVMSIGQIAEIGTMAILGWWLKRFGWRTTLIIGILGHAVRFAVFAFSNDPTIAVVVNVLHGICYAFFFATVYIFVDAHFPKDIRTSAQGLFNLLILGIGPFVANLVWVAVRDHYTTVVETVPKEVKELDYKMIFLYPSLTAFAAAVLLLIFFHPPQEAEQGGEAGPLPH